MCDDDPGISRREWWGTVGLPLLLVIVGFGLMGLATLMGWR